jgi:tRNA(His) 5'-end guanylyltransferase
VGFSRFTEQRFAKPFDPRIADHLIATARTLLAERGACYAYDLPMKDAYRSLVEQLTTHPRA